MFILALQFTQIMTERLIPLRTGCFHRQLQVFLFHSLLTAGVGDMFMFGVEAQGTPYNHPHST